MRDAAIYVRENSWDDAYELWNQAFEGTKNRSQLHVYLATTFWIADSIMDSDCWLSFMGSLFL